MLRAGNALAVDSIFYKRKQHLMRRNLSLLFSNVLLTYLGFEIFNGVSKPFFERHTWFPIKDFFGL